MSLCAACNNPLTIEITPSSDSDSDTETATPETVPDSVRLPCACHFHWQCLLDAYELAKCPHCGREILSSSPAASSRSTQQEGQEGQRLLVALHNEGGLQAQIDILPILKEESYLRAYPEERRCRAFLEFCREGDVGAIVDLLKGGHEQLGHTDVDAEGMGDMGKSAEEILRYQDPIGEMASGLHAAAANGHREVAWLLLLLASELPELEFPALVFQEAASLGVMRGDQSGRADIRELRDAHGRTAEVVAREAGVVWNGWIGNGRLALP